MRQSRYLLFYPFFRTELAAALGLLGLFNESVTEIDETLNFAVEANYRWYVPEILRMKGALQMLGGISEPRAIEDLFRQSMAQSGVQNAKYWELCTAVNLAALLQTQHRTAEALALLSPRYTSLNEGLSSPRVIEAKELLQSLMR